jgi:hypothetical protein
MAKYNHMYTLAFSLENNCPTGEKTTQAEIVSALNKRIAELIDEGLIPEAIGYPDDTYEVQEPHENIT